MDTGNYDQITLMKKNLGSGTQYIKENMNVYMQSFDGRVIGVEVPNFVELTVSETDPGFKGDTATGGSKRAKLETGAW